MISEEDWIRIRASSETAEKIRDSLEVRSDEAFEELRHPSNSTRTPMEIYSDLQGVLMRDSVIFDMREINPRHLRAGSIELRRIVVEDVDLKKAVEKFRGALKEAYIKNPRFHGPVRIEAKILYEIDREYYKSQIEKIKNKRETEC